MLGCLFDIFLISWDRPVMIKNFPLITAFAASQKFWCVVSSFSFVSMFFDLTFYFFFGPFCSSMLFNLYTLYGFLLPFCSWFLMSKLPCDNSICLMSEFGSDAWFVSTYWFFSLLLEYFLIFFEYLIWCIGW